MALKFGSPAWRKKYAPKNRKRKTKLKTTNPRRRKTSNATILRKIKALAKKIK